MSDKPRGIWNPWSPPEEGPAKGPAGPPKVRNELEVPVQVATDLVSFGGRAYSISVAVLPSKANLEVAAHHLGAFLAELLRAEPGARSVLEKQALGLASTLAPEVVLPLGQVTLYAKASSVDREAALRLAVDRLALALSEIRATSNKARPVFTAYSVTIARRAG